MDVVHADGKGVCLDHYESDQVKVVGRPMAIAPPIPILAGSLNGGQDRLDLDCGAFAIQNHLGSELSGVSREGGLEPTKVDLLN